MKRPTDKYNDPGPRTLRNLLVRGALLLVMAVVIGTLAGWTKRVRATDTAKSPDATFAARRLGTLGDQLSAAHGEMDLLRIQLDRADAIMAGSTKYQIPADLAASIYDIALSEGIDPALGFQLVKIESNFKATARSKMGAIGYTQLQVATARFYEPGVTEKALMTDRRAEPAGGLPLPERPDGQVRSRHPPRAARLQSRAGQGGRHPGAGRRSDERVPGRGAGWV